MQSSNPVFRKAEGFNGQRTYPASGMSYPSYGGGQTGSPNTSTYDPYAGGGGVSHRFHAVAGVAIAARRLFQIRVESAGEGAGRRRRSSSPLRNR